MARGQQDTNDYYHTGVINGQAEDLMPFPVSMPVLLRGQEQFNIYCTPCHSRVGNGRGMIVERGYKPAGDYMNPAILKKPLSHYFRVMTGWIWRHARLRRATDSSGSLGRRSLHSCAAA